jgi:hypothetical protein
MQDFDEYQIHLFKKFERFRKPYSGVAYPPYHKGMYLEEYFFKQFLLNGKRTKQYLIPVFWTNCYLSGTTEGLQQLLDSLDPEQEYFCVSQHDDAIIENLPPKTTHFNAGGNKSGIPIPLVCSPINYPKTDKKIFCSFVGSITHPIRVKMNDKLLNKKGFEIFSKSWTPEVDSFEKDFFLKKTSESLFSLCPRGYGASSFRFYEALQLGAVPVFIYDKPWFPYEDMIDWDSFSVRIHEKDIDKIQEILIEFAPLAFKMNEKGKEIYQKYFSLNSLPKQIYRILNAQ